LKARASLTALAVQTPSKQKNLHIVPRLRRVPVDAVAEPAIEIAVKQMEARQAVAAARVVAPGVNEEAAARAAEAEIVVRAVAGDRDAFSDLYENHYDQIQRYVLYRVSSLEEAEDITQRVFVQAWQAIGRYRPTGSPFVAWLFTIAHNLVVSFYRKHRQTAPLDDEIEEERPSSSPEFMAEAGFERDRTRSAVSALRPDYQKVIYLRFNDNRSHRDIAEELGKSEGAVRVMQHRALLKLRGILEHEQAA
jgi:RNA polymerase sigma-70 factor (ECF subfamily)